MPEQCSPEFEFNMSHSVNGKEGTDVCAHQRHHLLFKKGKGKGKEKNQIHYLNHSIDLPLVIR
jgi:hypothetical protein